MGRRATWTQWWIGVTGAVALAVLGAVGFATSRDLNLWIVLADAAVLGAMLVCAVVNRPRPYGTPAALLVPDERQRSAIRAVRRGLPVRPPGLHADAAAAVRRGWYVVGVVAAGWAGPAAVLAAGPVAGRGLQIAGAVILPAALVALGACGVGLRRADRADRAGTDARPRPAPHG